MSESHGISGSTSHDDLLFVCYTPCSTCAKARAWLNERHIAYTERNIRSDNPNVAELRDWYHRSGLPIRRFFNTSGRSYRALGLKDKLDGMSDEQALTLLSTDGMLVKRPIAVSAHTVLVGFAPTAWQEALQ